MKDTLQTLHLAEDTDVYKELVGRGADPEEVKNIVQTYYGEDITNTEKNA